MSPTVPPFRRLLVANRGEIALRVIRTCRVMGIETVAVCSEIDRGAPHVLAAERAVTLGPARARDSYLAVDRVIDAARSSEADAVHPGYGFLSESAELAHACADAGVTFVGPSPDVMTRTASKVAGRALAARAGVPVVPGETPDEQTVDGLVAAARRLGLPALVKPAAGGGGKGMHVVADETRLPATLAQARREAEAAFGDGTLYLERHLARPRHVEVQVVADQHDHRLHLYERECSVQRRYQKVIEEAPAPRLSDTLRARLTAAAVAVADAAGYDSLGTVEFLVDGHDEEAPFYFLEMNTRLQVEHPVTELGTGLDLVRIQIETAAGQPLAWPQRAVSWRGHAIEARVYAEDPDAGDLPQAGPLLRYREPTGPGLRVDGGVAEGDEVTVHYDPLLAKVIAQADSRDVARQRLQEALQRFVVLGVHTNLGRLARILRHARFVAGEVDTAFLRDDPAFEAADPAPPLDDVMAAVAAAAATAPGPPAEPASSTAADDPWTALGAWRVSS